MCLSKTISTLIVLNEFIIIDKNDTQRYIWMDGNTQEHSQDL